MKKLLNGLLLMSMGVALTGIAAEDDKSANFKSEEDKASYSIGFDFGVNILEHLGDLNFDVFAQGVEDAYKEKEPKISQEDMKTIVLDYRRKKVEQKKAEVEQMALNNLSESEQFLKANAEKDGVKTTESGLQYRILNEGEGSNPKVSDTVVVHYSGTFINGEEFDSSYRRGKPAEFPVTGVIKGWTEALQLMKPGARWQLFVPPHLAYGDRGQGAIGPNSLLIFMVELVEIKAKS